MEVKHYSQRRMIEALNQRGYYFQFRDFLQNTAGGTAIEPRGKDTLTTLLYPKYTSVIRDYARNTLKKLVGK